MPYIWESKDWPHFRWDAETVYANSYRYALNASRLARETWPLSEPERQDAVISLMVAEAQKTSWIEGESVSPRAIRAAILKQLGLVRTDRRQNPRARGIARLMIAARTHFAAPLTGAGLCEWHNQFLGELQDGAGLCEWHNQFLGELQDGAGRWRLQPVWIVSGPAGGRTVDYEGPPAARVEREMARFIAWFNAGETLPGPVRSGVAHLYFECIHPFQDGNGRMGRAVAEIALSQELGYPAPLRSSSVIEQRRKGYYEALRQASSQDSMDITHWLRWWTKCVVDAQTEARAQFGFLAARKQFWRAYADRVNDRQKKTLTRMLRDGPADLKEGMSAKRHMRLTGCSKATASRDLTALVRIGALERLPGGGRSTRYAIRLPEGSIAPSPLPLPGAAAAAGAPAHSVRRPRPAGANEAGISLRSLSG